MRFSQPERKFQTVYGTHLVFWKILFPIHLTVQNVWRVFIFEDSIGSCYVQPSASVRGSVHADSYEFFLQTCLYQHRIYSVNKPCYLLSNELQSMGIHIDISSAEHHLIIPCLLQVHWTPWLPLSRFTNVRLEGLFSPTDHALGAQGINHTGKEK